MKTPRRYTLSNDLAVQLLTDRDYADYSQEQSFARFCSQLNELPNYDAVAVSALVISYLLEHEERMGHELIAFLAKDNRPSRVAVLVRASDRSSRSFS